MSSKFEWHTDEVTWTEAPEADRGAGPNWRHHWRILLALLLILALIGGISYALLKSRATNVENSIAADVLSSHELVQRAIAAQDGELFASLLWSGHEPWRDGQIRLLERQGLWERVTFGLWLVPQPAETASHVTMAPDLESALVVTDWPYVTEESETVSEKVLLQQTVLYRRVANQWLLAPLPDDTAFWGEPVTTPGDYVTLIVPGRDAELGHRLAIDLNGAVKELCQLPDVPCPPVFTLRLQLLTDFASLDELTRNYRSINMNRRGANRFSISMPAPTLVGLPLDEAGYRALYRGYAGWIAAVLVNQFNRAQQPTHSFIEAQLAQLDLVPPPLNRSHPLQAQSQAPPPVPLPEQDILMMCFDQTDGPRIWHYDLGTSAWSDETGTFAEEDEALFGPTAQPWTLVGAPGDHGALLQVTRFDNSGQYGRLFLWRDGEVQTLFTEAYRYFMLSPLYLPYTPFQERYILFYPANAEQSAPVELQWLDPNQCPGSSCQLQAGEGIPVWSPDGSSTLVLQVGPGLPELFLGDATGAILSQIGAGWSPFWLDNELFAYVRPVGDLPVDESDLEFSMDSELVTSTISEIDEGQLLLRSDELLELIPPEQRPGQQGLAQVLPDPERPDVWYIRTAIADSGVRPRAHYVFRFDGRSDELTLLFTLDRLAYGYGMQLNGNGRFLTLLYASEGDWWYRLFDLEQGQRRVYGTPISQTGSSPVDWSADERWLLMTDETQLRLVLPGSNFERTIAHGMAGCHTAVWVNSAD